MSFVALATAGSATVPPTPASPQQTEVLAALAATPLYGQPSAEQPAAAWQVGAHPLPLPANVMAQLPAIGEALLAFWQACDDLYHLSLTGEAYPWVAEQLNANKPADLIALQHHKPVLPRVIRPDLLLGDNSELTLCEIDAVPGGLGFTALLNDVYSQAGFACLQPQGQSLPQAFYAMLCHESQAITTEPNPLWVVAYCDESADYFAEWTYLCQQAQHHGANLHVAHVNELTTQGQHVTYNGQQVHGVYRFVELFSRHDEPAWLAVEAAWQAGGIALTPTPNLQAEEKLWLAWWWHPLLQSYWHETLPPQHKATLSAIIPQGWAVSPLLDDAASPWHWPHWPALSAQKQPLTQWQALGNASQKERQLVLKPSGFSPLAWGGKGLTIGHDVPTAQWQTALAEALASPTPYLLQRFHKAGAVDLPRLKTQEEGQVVVVPAQGRVRLCPYYLRTNETTLTLAGALATHCPLDKKKLHGMRSASMVPVAAQLC